MNFKKTIFSISVVFIFLILYGCSLQRSINAPGLSSSKENEKRNLIGLVRPDTSASLSAKYLADSFLTEKLLPEFAVVKPTLKHRKTAAAFYSYSLARSILRQNKASFSEENPSTQNKPVNVAGLVSFIAGILAFGLILIVNNQDEAPRFQVYLSLISAGVAFVSGLIAKSQFKKNPDKYSGKDIAEAGYIMGLIYCVAAAVILLLLLLLAALIVLIFGPMLEGVK